MGERRMRRRWKALYKVAKLLPAIWCDTQSRISPSPQHLLIPSRLTSPPSNTLCSLSYSCRCDSSFLSLLIFKASSYKLSVFLYSILYCISIRSLFFSFHRQMAEAATTIATGGDNGSWVLVAAERQTFRQRIDIKKAAEGWSGQCWAMRGSPGQAGHQGTVPSRWIVPLLPTRRWGSIFGRGITWLPRAPVPRQDYPSKSLIKWQNSPSFFETDESLKCFIFQWWLAINYNNGI